MSNIINKNRGSSLSTVNKARDALANLSKARDAVSPTIEYIANKIVATTSKNLAQEKATRVEIIFILDVSGSMSGTEKDVSYGFNQFVNKQSECNTVITTYLFSDYCNKVHDKQSPSQRPSLSYSAYGMTSCYDAMVQVLKYECKTAGGKQIVVLCTDGYDQSSKYYSLADARNEVRRCQDLGVEFLVLGAGDIDAKEIARMFGINLNNAMTHDKDSSGIDAAFQGINSAVIGFRKEGRIPLNWGDVITKDKTSKQLSAGSTYTKRLPGGK